VGILRNGDAAHATCKRTAQRAFHKKIFIFRFACHRMRFVLKVSAQNQN